jgi:hypothetical protein
VQFIGAWAQVRIQPDSDQVIAVGDELDFDDEGACAASTGHFESESLLQGFRFGACGIEIAHFRGGGALGGTPSLVGNAVAYCSPGLSDAQVGPVALPEFQSDFCFLLGPFA